MLLLDCVGTPNGEWNTLELYTIGRTAVYVVNGQVVQVLRDITIAAVGDANEEQKPLSSGQLQIQCEGAEAYYRRIEICTITDYPADIRIAAAFDQ